MRTIAHISDPHFGRHDPIVTEALLDELSGVSLPAPTVVAISGDLTQRARADQFVAAREFLDSLAVPYVVVPGNHDVPLWDFVSRFWRPLKRYRKYITDDLCPCFVDDEIAVIGVNTAHGMTMKDGRITEEQTKTTCRLLSKHDAKWRVIVAHHPFVVPAGVPRSDIVDGAERALPRLEACGIDVILTGHLHTPHSVDIAGFRADAGKLVAVHAGTCISTRLRGEPNGYNRLTFEHDHVAIVHRVWNGTVFVDGPIKVYRRRSWVPPDEPRFEKTVQL